MTKARSPQYPAIGLKEAIEKVTAVYHNDYQNPIPREVAGAHMGYKSLHGNALGALSALVKYGLLEGRGDETKVSDLAVTIIAHEPGTPERAAALKDAAAKPKLFAELNARFPNGKASDQAVRSYLLTQKYIPSAADAAIRSYRETKALVESEAGGYSGEEEPELEQEKPAMQPSIGDRRPPAGLSAPIGTPIPTGEPYRVSLGPGGLQGTFDLKNVSDADDLIRAINAWKMLLKPASEIKPPE